MKAANIFRYYYLELVIISIHFHSPIEMESNS